MQMFSIELLPQYDTVTYIAVQPHFLWYRMDIGNSQQRCRQNEDEGNACVVAVVVVVAAVDGNAEDGARRKDGWLSLAGCNN